MINFSTFIKSKSEHIGMLKDVILMTNTAQFHLNFQEINLFYIGNN